MPTLVDELKTYFKETPQEQIEKDWDKTKHWDNVGTDAIIYCGKMKDIYYLNRFKKFLEDNILYDAFITEMKYTEGQHYTLEKYCSETSPECYISGLDWIGSSQGIAFWSHKNARWLKIINKLNR